MIEGAGEIAAPTEAAGQQEPEGVFHSIQPGTDRQREEPNRPGAVLFVPLSPSMQVGIGRAQDHERAVEAEPNVHQRSAYRASCQDESKPSQTGQSSRDDIKAA